MIDTTNCDMAAERAARASKTETEMENVRLRRRLMEAEDKAMRVAGRAALVMRERDDLSDEVQRLLCEKADLMGRAGLSERERRILDMWPRFEDGEPVWFGDEYVETYGNTREVVHVIFADGKAGLMGDVIGKDWLDSLDERVKRPATEVLDADGVPIHAGDTVWDIKTGCKWTVDGFGPFSIMMTDLRLKSCAKNRGGMFCNGSDVTHARPDSWERLEEDASEFARDNQLPHDVDQMERDVLDLIRRAKKLAGVE